MRSALPRNGTRLSSAALRLIEPARALGQPAEHVVVVHHGLAVGADLDVNLDAIAGGDGRAHGAGGIFDRARALRHAARDGRSVAR